MLCPLLVESSPPGILHDQTEVGLLQADPQHPHDVNMLQEPEQFPLLQHLLLRLVLVLVLLAPGRLHCDLVTSVVASENLAEAAGTDDLLHTELGPGDVRRVEPLQLLAAEVGKVEVTRGHEVAGEHPDPVLALARPPALVPGDLVIFAQHLDHVALHQPQLVLALSVVVVDCGPQRLGRGLGHLLLL